MIDVTEFDKVEVRVGTVVTVAENKKARHPAGNKIRRVAFVSVITF